MAAIKAARRETKDKRADARLKALELRAEGMELSEVSQATGFHAAYVSQLVAKYRDHGLEAISGNHYGGNHRNMSFEEEAAILAPFKARAEKGELVEISEIETAYQQAVGHSIGTSQIYYVLHRHGWRKVMPRSRHPKKASEEVIETGFGRINHPKYCWCEKGIRPSVPCHHIREYRYAYGAVEPLTGESCFLVMPYCNTACMNLFLRELSKQFPQDNTVNTHRYS